MQTLEAIRKKIESAEDLRDIVKTMRTLAAVNIHHYEQAVGSVNEYYRTVEMGLQVVLREGSVKTPRQISGHKENVYYLVLGTDQGLCGGFNDQIVNFAFDEMKKSGRPAARDHIICVGARALAAVEERKQEAAGFFSLPGSLPGITPLVRQVVLDITDLQSRKKIDGVVLFHHKLTSQVSYEPVMSTLLPLDAEWLETVSQGKWPCRSLPTFTMDRDSLFSSLFRQYIFVSLYRAFAESMASENAARLMSMQSAEKNIQGRMEQLTALYRTERQNAITSELLDIVSGFEALRDEL